MKKFKATFLTSLGAGLEYYDFVIYGMMIPYLSQLFYPQFDSSVSMLKMFAIFAVGYISRPFGGVLFAMIGDKYGRRSALILVMLLMALSTACIGLLPTYENWGVAATVMLVLLRLLQGFSYGAELPGAITIISENNEKKGAHCGFAMSSTAMGATLGSVVLYVLSATLTEQQILAWGWRIPFLFGLVLAAVSFYMRFNVAESQQFVASKDPKRQFFAPLKEVVLKNPKKVFFGILLTLFSATLVITNTYFVSYFTTYYNFTPNDLYISTILSRLWCAVLLTTFGIVSDRVGCKNLMVTTTSLFVGCALLYMYFDPLQGGSFAKLLICHFVYETFVAAYVASYFPTMAELFETRFRYTGIAMCYNFAYLLASFTPSLLTSIVVYTGDPKVIFFVHIFFAISAAFVIQRIEKDKTIRAIAHAAGSPA